MTGWRQRRGLRTPKQLDPQAASLRRLAKLRQGVDTLDETIIKLLAARCGLASSIGKEKRTAGVGVVDENREAQVLAHVQAFAARYGLDPESTRRIFAEIISMGRAQQEK